MSNAASAEKETIEKFSYDVFEYLWMKFGLPGSCIPIPFTDGHTSQNEDFLKLIKQIMFVQICKRERLREIFDKIAENPSERSLATAYTVRIFKNELEKIHHSHRMHFITFSFALWTEAALYCHFTGKSPKPIDFYKDWNANIWRWFLRPYLESGGYQGILREMKNVPPRDIDTEKFVETWCVPYGEHNAYAMYQQQLQGMRFWLTITHNYVSRQLAEKTKPPVSTPEDGVMATCSTQQDNVLQNKKHVDTPSVSGVSGQPTTKDTSDLTSSHVPLKDLPEKNLELSKEIKRMQTDSQLSKDKSPQPTGIPTTNDTSDHTSSQLSLKDLPEKDSKPSKETNPIQTGSQLSNNESHQSTGIPTTKDTSSLPEKHPETSKEFKSTQTGSQLSKDKSQEPEKRSESSKVVKPTQAVSQLPKDTSQQQTSKDRYNRPNEAIYGRYFYDLFRYLWLKFGIPDCKIPKPWCLEIRYSSAEFIAKTARKVILTQLHMRDSFRCFWDNLENQPKNIRQYTRNYFNPSFEEFLKVQNIAPEKIIEYCLAFWTEAALYCHNSGENFQFIDFYVEWSEFYYNEIFRFFKGYNLNLCELAYENLGPIDTVLNDFIEKGGAVYGKPDIWSIFLEEYEKKQVSSHKFHNKPLAQSYNVAQTLSLAPRQDELKKQLELKGSCSNLSSNSSRAMNRSKLSAESPSVDASSKPLKAISQVQVNSPSTSLEDNSLQLSKTKSSEKNSSQLSTESGSTVGKVPSEEYCSKANSQPSKANGKKKLVKITYDSLLHSLDVSTKNPCVIKIPPVGDALVSAEYQTEYPYPTVNLIRCTESPPCVLLPRSSLGTLIGTYFFYFSQVSTWYAAVTFHTRASANASSKPLIVGQAEKGRTGKKKRRRR